MEDMYKLNGKEFTEDNVINSHNFMRHSDIIYAAYFPDDELNNLNLNNYTEIHKSNGATLLKTHSFKLQENNIIFCHTMFISSLFKHLKNIKEFKNIKLITHQTDIPITKELFSQKPECISSWYSINVSYKNSSLIPIPIGIGNNHNKKTITIKDFKNYKKNQVKTIKVYCNFNINTNYFHRYNACKMILNKTWVVKSKPKLKLDEYFRDLNKNKYTFAPWGNGFDTHRLWEAIYAGSIPITKDHLAFYNFKDLPIIYLNNYKNIDINELEKVKFNNLNFKKLEINWWFELMKANKIVNNKETIEINESNEEKNNYLHEFYVNNNKELKIKKRITYLRKLHKNLIGRKVNKYFGV